MQTDHVYKMTSHVPFSVTVGGLSRFRPNRRAAEAAVRISVTWKLRDVETGQIITATHHADSEHETLYGTLVSDAPFRADAIYETLSVSAPQSDAVRDPAQAQSPSHHRIGLAMGTHVMTARGEVAVENLTPGDRVVTRDHGLQPLCFIGRETRRVDAANGPVILRRDTVMNARDLVVSADTRIVVKGVAALANYGAKEVLVPARNMVDGTQIVHAVDGEMTFFQLVLSRHEVIYAEAAAVESFMADASGILALSDENRLNLCAALPMAPQAYGSCARSYVNCAQ